ncbi:MAG: DUF3054 family protein [Armatimonadota bacterium]|nr:DUF3054 family protein [Armatimonadota bacterium]MDR5697151.1 DUF3054 family protein [Armatimonadota bacterium]
MRPPTIARTGAREALADALALLLFAVLGARFHSLPLAADVVLRTALPLWVTWFFAATWLRTYRMRSGRTWLVNWALAVPAGLLLRQVLLGRGLDAATGVFVGVGTLATLLLLVAVRALAALFPR